MFPSPRRRRFLPSLLATGLLLLTVRVRAEVKLPSIFGDHMVLQQEAHIPVWGWANPGETVTVTFAGKSASATTQSDGKWRANLPPLPDGASSGDLVISGSNKITLHDVLVGDVWLCSGQSNMEFGLASASNAKQAIPDATDDQIRLFHVPRQMAIIPLDQTVPASWQVCTPRTIPSFTAVGYFFAKNLRSVLHRPIGLIESSWGGTPAEAWTDLPTLSSNPALRRYADAYQKAAAKFPQGQAEFAVKAAAVAALQRQWMDAVKAAAAAHESPPPTYHSNLGVNSNMPTVLFDGMIHPLIPYAIKGAIWYQGETNARNAADSTEYRTLFPAMITDWRHLWQEGDFPFLFVQLANFNNPAGTWPLLRESQLKTLSLANTGMAVTIDIGTGGNIHPPDKADVGLRLALAARHVAYGENLVYSGPIYDSMKVEGNKIRVSFQPATIGGGLILGAAPWTDAHDTPVSKTALAGFQIAGADQSWFDAQASIDGNTILVSSPQVAAPVAVRYAWAQDPRCNLYNKENLPASPFRTDQWEQAITPSARAAVRK